jgi:predicted dehydrogenase
MAIAALDAGKHVVIEKPLAADLASAARIAAAARQASTTVTVCLPMRHDARVIAARAAIDDGQLGMTRGALATYLNDKPSSYYFGGFSSRASSTWRLSKERSGGGVIIMNLLHQLDLVRYLFDCEAVSVRASTLTSEPTPGIEDLASVVVDFDGKIATFVGGSRVLAGGGDSLRLWGDAGLVEVFPDLHVHSARSDADKPPARTETTRPRAPRSRSSQSRVERRVLRSRVMRRLRPRPPVARVPDEELLRRVRFVEGVASGIALGEQPGPDVDDGLAIQSLVEAAYLSAERDATIRPPDLLRGITG